MTIKAIETRYAGHRFRSRLEARWAVFFDTLGIKWEYEPQGFHIGPYPACETDSGLYIRERDYLPDFLLTDCGTWVEVKGNGNDLDRDLMRAAAVELPRMPHRIEAGPRLMILGPIPSPDASGDWGWTGMNVFQDEDGRSELIGGLYGFGSYHKNLRPRALSDTSCADSYTCWDDPEGWPVPRIDPYESGASEGYRAARSARFEHGETP